MTARSGGGIPEFAGRFIGFDKQLTALRVALDRSQLVTVTGPAGSGKTRLVAEVLRRGSDLARIGYCEVDATWAVAVAEAVSRALDLPECRRGGDRALEVGRALAVGGPPLAWLDLGPRSAAAVAPIVAAWLAHADGARGCRRVVVSARRPLNVPHEFEAPLGPHDEAVALFRARVPRHLRSALTDPDRVAATVERVSGRPLALELAAGRAAELGLIASAGDASLRLDPDAPVRSAFHLSWSHLHDGERAVLTALSAFAGELTLAAAERVVDGAQLPARRSVLDVVEVLTRLGFLSLRGPERFVIPGGVRECLGELGVDSSRRHLAHAQWAVERGEALRCEAGTLSAPSLARHDRELAEVVRRATSAPEWGDLEARACAVRATGAIRHGCLTTHLGDLRRALAGVGSEQLGLLQLARARLLERDGRRGDAAAALRFAADADPGLAVRCLCTAARLALADGERDRAGALVDEAEPLAGDDPSARARVGTVRAEVVLASGSAVRAADLLGLALDAARSGADPEPVGQVLLGLGGALLHLPGRAADAARRLTEALPLLADDGDRAWAVARRDVAVLLQGGLPAVDEPLIADPSLAAYVARTRTWAGALSSGDPAALGAPVLADSVARARSALALQAAGRPDQARRVASAARAAADAHTDFADPLGASVASRLAGCLVEHHLSAAGLDAWWFGPDGRWFVSPRGERMCLEQRGPLRRLLGRLAHARVRRPGATLSVPALVACGWPGGDLPEHVGRNRLHVTFSVGRSLGLALLQRAGTGYRLDPDAPVRLGR